MMTQEAPPRWLGPVATALLALGCATAVAALWAARCSRGAYWACAVVAATCVLAAAGTLVMVPWKPVAASAVEAPQPPPSSLAATGSLIPFAVHSAVAPAAAGGPLSRAAAPAALTAMAAEPGPAWSHFAQAPYSAPAQAGWEPLAAALAAGRPSGAPVVVQNTALTPAAAAAELESPWEGLRAPPSLAAAQPGTVSAFAEAPASAPAPAQALQTHPVPWGYVGYEDAVRERTAVPTAAFVAAEHRLHQEVAGTALRLDSRTSMDRGVTVLRVPPPQDAAPSPAPA